MSDWHPNGDCAKGVDCPILRITFSPETYTVKCEGSVPNLEFGKYMLTTALHVMEQQIAARDNPRIAVANTVPLP
jgi:hypothetical protein